MMGLIVPGGWEGFFRFIGEPYSGPMWLLEDDRNFFEVLLPRLKAAAEKFDMIPCPQQEQFSPQPWLEDENQLPGMPVPYFLKNASGPAYVLGGIVCRPLITTVESNGRFSIASIDGASQHHVHSIFARDEQMIRFADIHHAFHIVDGKVDFEIDHLPTKLSADDFLYVPKSMPFRFRITSRFAKVYVFCNGGGLVDLYQNCGKDYHGAVIPEQAEPLSVDVLSELRSLFEIVAVH